MPRERERETEREREREKKTADKEREEEREMVMIGEGGEGENRGACMEKKEADRAEIARVEVRKALVVRIVVPKCGFEGDGATGVIGGEEKTERRVGDEEVKRSAMKDKEVDAAAQQGEAKNSKRSTIADSDDVEEKKHQGDGAVVGIGETDGGKVTERDRKEEMHKGRGLRASEACGGWEMKKR